MRIWNGAVSGFGLLLMALATLGGPSTTRAADPSVQFDDSIDFKTISAYAWHEGTPARHPENQKWIEAMVDRELQAKGMRKVDDGPQVWVVTHALVDEQSLDQLADANYWEFVTGITSVDPYAIGAGTLVVDLVDAETEKVIWRAAVSAKIEGPSKRIQGKVDKAVKKLFKLLPR
jgi:hypothetical protein